MKKNNSEHAIKAGIHADVNVVFTEEAIAECGIPWSEEVLQIDVSKSGAFDYGNGTSTSVTRTSGGRERTECYDTRYQRGSFEQLVEDIVWTIFRENVESFEILNLKETDNA